MNKYKTYVSEIPKKLRKLNKEAYFAKPVGGLWGCKGDEWKEFCIKYNPEHDPEKCDMNNLNPVVLEEHAFMYYTVLNIVLLSLSSKSEEEDKTTEEIVENITKVIKLFD